MVRRILCYTVSSEFDDAALADEYCEWLIARHLADVCAAGAIQAELVRFDGTPPRVEVRYQFASRAAFEDYERDHAPRLRAEGLALFPAERGIRMHRSVGELLSRRQPEE